MSQGAHRSDASMRHAFGQKRSRCSSDGPISRAVAFEQLLNNGEVFANLLVRTLSEDARFLKPRTLSYRRASAATTAGEMASCHRPASHRENGSPG